MEPRGRCDGVRASLGLIMSAIDVVSAARARMRALWCNLFRRGEVDADLATELNAYVDAVAARYEAAGLPPDDARRQALIDVGGLSSTTDATRDVWTGNGLLVALRESRQTARALSRSPL